MELINVPCIFYDPSVKAYLLTEVKLGYPTVILSLINPIRSKIFNFNNFIHNLDFKDFLQDSFILECNCEGSNFNDRCHQHIVTGESRIRQNT